MQKTSLLVFYISSLRTHVPSLKISQPRIPNDQMSVGTVHVADVRVSGAIHLSTAAMV